MVLPTAPAGPVAFSAPGYVPLAYSPAALALAIGRLLDLPLLVMFYLARLVNLLAGVVLCWIAVGITPMGKRILAATALLPMATFLRSSISPDGLLIAVGLLAFALAASEALEKWPKRAALLTVCFILVVSKPIYLFMPLLAMLIGNRSRRVAGRTLAHFIAAILTTALAVAIAGWWVVAPLQPADDSTSELQLSTPQPPLRAMSEADRTASAGELSIQEQARGILRNPAGFASIVATEYWSQLPALSYQFVGRFGWLDTPLPLTVRMLYLGMLFLIALTDGRPDFSLSFGQRAVLAAVFLGTLLATAGIIYITWTPVGAGYIEGMQGRYFIPVAPAALLLLTSRRLSTVITARRLTIIMAIIAALTLEVAAWSIYSRFYGRVPSPMMYIAGHIVPSETLY